MANRSIPNYTPPPSIQPPNEFFLNYFKLPDISFWEDDPTTQQEVNFARMAQVTRAVIIRAGQNTWEDIKFRTFWSLAKSAGLVRGSYWFYDSRANPKQQAEKWVDVLGDDPGEMELWCDFEERYGGRYQGWRSWFDFMERVKTLLPHKTLGIYTGYYYWQEFAAGVNYFAQYPLWIAAYNSMAPRVPPIWQDWSFWQFTDNGDGSLYGVESKNIDLSYFKGSEDEFLARYQVVPAQETIIAKFGNTLVEYRRTA